MRWWRRLLFWRRARTNRYDFWAERFAQDIRELNSTPSRHRGQLKRSVGRESRGGKGREAHEIDRETERTTMSTDQEYLMGLFASPWPTGEPEGFWGRLAFRFWCRVERFAAMRAASLRPQMTTRSPETDPFPLPHDAFEGQRIEVPGGTLEVGVQTYDPRPAILERRRRQAE